MHIIRYRGKIIKLFQNFQIIKDIFYKKNYIFSKNFGRAQAPLGLQVAPQLEMRSIHSIKLKSQIFSIVSNGDII